MSVENKPNLTSKLSNSEQPDSKKIDSGGNKDKNIINTDGLALEVLKSDNEGVSNPNKGGTKTIVSDIDIDSLRKQLGMNPDINGKYKETVAVGRCNIPGLEDETFVGASVIPRREAGLPDIDEVFPNRSIVAPVEYKGNPALVQQAKHAEENVMAEFEAALKRKKISPKDAKGDFYIIQSNPNGACPTCMLDMLSPSPKGNEGIFRQFVNKYPNVNIHLTTYKGGGTSTGQGVLRMDYTNGQISNVIKTFRGKIKYM